MRSNEVIVILQALKAVVCELEGIPSTLQFLLDHPLEHFRDLGYETSAQTTQILALAFGKDEVGGRFEFQQTNVDRVLQGIQSMFRGPLAVFSPVMRPTLMQTLKNLCVSLCLLCRQWYAPRIDCLRRDLIRSQTETSNCWFNPSGLYRRLWRLCY